MAERITMKTTLPIEVSKARKLYNAGNDTVKAILEKSFGKILLTRSIEYLVKTYEDACAVLGEEPVDFVKQNNILIQNGFKPLPPHEIAYQKLVTIIEALNEGWIPDICDDDAIRWYPRFKPNSSSFASDYSYYEYSNADAGSGSRLCLKSEKLSDYCGKQFLDLWKTFILYEG